jgi:DNA-binding NarL/FixJ family response regulator
MVDVWIMTVSPARRDWLLRTVSADLSIRVAGTATTFPFLRSLMAERSADIAVIDLEAETDPAVFRDWLLELTDFIAVIFLGAEPHAALFNRMLRAGAGGMLRTDASADQIVQAIKSVAAGLMIFDSALTPARADEDALLEPLTPRESEVLRLLADGLPNKEIASRLNISEHTIKFHIRSILGKLGASSRTEAVSRGIRSGLIEL